MIHLSTEQFRPGVTFFPKRFFSFNPVNRGVHCLVFVNEHHISPRFQPSTPPIASAQYFRASEHRVQLVEFRYVCTYTSVASSISQRSPRAIRSVRVTTRQPFFPRFSSSSFSVFKSSSSLYVCNDSALHRSPPLRCIFNAVWY